MHNCLVLGAGRSGTSMVAGALAGAGYFMGNTLVPPRASNPRGFFEDAEINGVNEELLAQVVPARPWPLGRWLYSSRPTYGQRWLAQVPLDVAFSLFPELDARIRALTARAPFCFKDPRFSYTLPIWRPLLGDAALICVFRDPAVTVASILKECRDTKLLRNLRLGHERAVQVWTLMYRHILERHRFEGRWLFLHYDQVLYGDGLPLLESFVGAPADRTFPAAALRRSTAQHEVSKEARNLYAQLCRLAGWTAESSC